MRELPNIIIESENIKVSGIPDYHYYSNDLNYDANDVINDELDNNIVNEELEDDDDDASSAVAPITDDKSFNELGKYHDVFVNSESENIFEHNNFDYF